MRKCKKCGKEIVFIKTKAGKLAPVDYESLQEYEKGLPESHLKLEKHHISHFATCPFANSFRKRG